MLLIACRLRTESLTWIASPHDLRNLMNRQEFDSDVWNISDDDASRYRWSRLNYKTLHANSRTFVFIVLETERGQSASYHRKVKLIESEAIKKKCRRCSAFSGSHREEKLWRFLSLAAMVLLKYFLEHNKYINHFQSFFESIQLIMHYEWNRSRW